MTPISIKEAAAITGRKPWDIYKPTESGELPFAMLNGLRLAALQDVRPLTIVRAASRAPGDLRLSSASPAPTYATSCRTWATCCRG